jgi:hypothetical protein
LSGNWRRLAVLVAGLLLCATFTLTSAARDISRAGDAGVRAPVVI